MTRGEWVGADGKLGGHWETIEKYNSDHESYAIPVIILRLEIR